MLRGFATHAVEAISSVASEEHLLLDLRYHLPHRPEALEVSFACASKCSQGLDVSDQTGHGIRQYDFNKRQAEDLSRVLGDLEVSTLDSLYVEAVDSDVQASLKASEQRAVTINTATQWNSDVFCFVALGFGDQRLSKAEVSICS